MTNLHTCYRGGNSDKESGFWLGFHYDKDVVEELKKKIPHTERRWNEETKLWWVSEKYDELLQGMFSNFYALIHLQGSLF